MQSGVYSFESRKFENFYFDTKLSSTRLRVLISKKNVFYFEFIFEKVNFENVLRNLNHEIGFMTKLVCNVKLPTKWRDLIGCLDWLSWRDLIGCLDWLSWRDLIGLFGLDVFIG